MAKDKLEKVYTTIKIDGKVKESGEILFNGTENHLFYEIGKKVFQYIHNTDYQEVRIIAFRENDEGDNERIVDLMYQPRTHWGKVQQYADKQGIFRTNYHFNIQSVNRDYGENANIYRADYPLETDENSPYYYKFKDLRCVIPLSNNYKKYILDVENTNNTKTIDGIYGEISIPLEDIKRGYGGQMSGVVPYPSFAYWVLYFEKLSKDYTDETQKIEETELDSEEELEKLKEEYNKETDKIVDEIKNAKKDKYYTIDTQKFYNDIVKIARNYCSQALQGFTSDKSITLKQLNSAKALYNELLENEGNTYKFNQTLQELLKLSPRTRDFSNTKLSRHAGKYGVCKMLDFMASKNPEDKKEIIDREKELIDAMETIVLSNRGIEKAEKLGKNEPYFQNISLEKVDDFSFLKDKLSKSLFKQIKRVFRIHNPENRERFDKFKQEHNVKVLKEVWHGTPSQNVLPILETCLKTNKELGTAYNMTAGTFLENPATRINPIYFSAIFKGEYGDRMNGEKSINYTSKRGTYHSWTNGSDRMGYMFLCNIAYDNPLVPNSYTEMQHYTKEQVLASGVIHAKHENMNLCHDEIGVYFGEMVEMDNGYIVEFDDNLI